VDDSLLEGLQRRLMCRTPHPRAGEVLLDLLGLLRSWRCSDLDTLGKSADRTFLAKASVAGPL
jgi:hypothetical protein